MAINRNGFEVTNTGLVIDKDTQAQLAYTFDWSEWLDEGDSLTSVEYEVAARRNDPTPIVIETYGISGSDTYVELSGGQADKTYIVTCKITTTNGLIDRRAFRVQVLDRQA